WSSTTSIWASAIQPANGRRETAPSGVACVTAPPGPSAPDCREPVGRSGMEPFFAVTEKVVGAAAAYGGVVRVRPNIAAVMPATFAFLLLGWSDLDAQRFISGGMHRGARDDQDESQVIPQRLQPL